MKNLTYIKTAHRPFLLSALLGLSLATPALADQKLFTTQKPELTNVSDGANAHYELGMRFTAKVDGKIKAIRFYKSAKEKGAKHVGRVFDSAGRVVAMATFSGESASGWQRQDLALPYAIRANQEYVVSVNTGNTYYVADDDGFANPIVNMNLSAPRAAGVYGPLNRMPTSSYRYTNYFRDIVFEAGPVAPPATDTQAPSVPGNVAATAVSASQINLSFSASTDNVGVANYRIERCQGSGCTGFGQISQQTQLNLASTGLAPNTVYRFRVRAADAKGNLSAYSAIAQATTLSATEPPVPPVAGYPNAGNTGVPAGKVLTKFSGTLYVTQDNAVIDGLEITGNVVVEAKNVVLKNSKIISGTPWHLVTVQENATGFTMMDCELDGKGSTVNGLLGFGTILRNNVHGFDNGLNVWGGHLEGNFIHGFASVGEEPHFDGIEINGGVGIKIIRNTVILEQGQTSALMLNNYFGPLGQIEVRDNYLAGGGYTIYLDHRHSSAPVDNSTIKMTNNKLGKGTYGYWALYGNNFLRSGNFDAVTGQSVDNQ